MYTPVKLDKMRNFRYGMRSLALIERTLGKPLARLDFNAITVDEIMTVVWAGLVHEDKDLTVERLYDIVDDNNIPLNTIVDALQKAIGDAYGSPDEGVTEDTNPPAAAAQ